MGTPPRLATAVDAVVDAYRTDGYTVEVTQRFASFARLAVRPRFAHWSEQLLADQT